MFQEEIYINSVHGVKMTDKAILNTDKVGLSTVQEINL